MSLNGDMTIRMNINELYLVQKGSSWIETIFMQIKEVVTRYENLLILSLDTTEVKSHYEIIFKHLWI